MSKLEGRIKEFQEIGMRYGQSLSNAIWELDKQLYLDINATILDCYFDHGETERSQEVIKIYYERGGL